MSGADSDFMAMLHEAGVTAGSRWNDVQRQLASDVRFQAVVGEHKLTLFRDYVRLRQEVDGLKVSDAEKDFMVRVCCNCSLLCSAQHLFAAQMHVVLCLCLACPRQACCVCCQCHSHHPGDV
jgi:FF domain